MWPGVVLVVLAAESTPEGIWGQPVVLALIAAGAAVMGAVATVVVKRMSRPVDDATVLKTHVEAEKLRAETDRMRIDSDGREVEIARGLLDDIRKELDRYRAEMERVRAESERRIAEVVEGNAKQHAEVTARLDAMRARQAQMRDELLSHIPWDVAVTEILRDTHPEFPSPPPIGLD